MAYSSADKKEQNALREKNWEQVQVKAFTAWLNSYLENRNARIHDLFGDLQDGVLLNHFLEIVEGKKLPNRWDLTPTRKVQKLENLSIGLNYITQVMNVRLVGIGAEDIFAGHTKLILGLVWSLFRALRMSKIAGNSDLASAGGRKALEEGLLKWAREQTEGYERVNIPDFKYGFRDGLAFSALINKYDPSLLDYGAISKDDSKETKETNLTRAFEIAEQHLKIPKLLDVADLLEGDPDERIIQLYVSMFFHAYSAKEEKERIDREKQGISSKLEDLESSLAKEAEERERLLREKEELARGQAAMESDLAEKAKRTAELEQQKTKLQMEVEELRRQLEEFNDLKAREKELQEKMEALEELIEKETEGKEENLELARSLREELEQKKKEVEVLRAKAEQNDEEKIGASKELAETRDKLNEQIEKLKRRLKEENDVRQGRERLNSKLKAENERLKKAADVNAKTSTAWDILRRNLEEHLEDLYCWREVQNEGETDLKKRIDIKSMASSLSAPGKDFGRQFAALSEKLEEENGTLLRVLNVKDAIALRKEAVEKQGYLQKKGQRNDTTWRKRWFVLRGSTLAYYNSDTDMEEEKGSISLSSCSVSPIDDTKFKVTVEGRDLVLDASSKKDRDRWLCALSGAIAYLGYKKEAEENDVRPDLRLLEFFTAESVPILHLDDRSVSVESAQAIANILSFHEELRVLSVENASLEDDEARVLVDALRRVKGLQTLRLGRNKLTSATAALLGEVLRDAKSLAELSLSDNEIGDEGLEALAAGVRDHKNLTVLDLTGNQVSDKGAAALAAAIGDGHNLESLLLGKNSINDEGAEAIAALLERNKSITSVQLQGNNISDKGVIAIANALKRNKSVSELDLSSNSIGNAGALELRKLLDRNKVLEGVNLSLNKIHGGPDMASFLGTDSFFFPNLSFSRRIGK